MIKHVWTVVCEHVFVDSTTNNTALTVLEELRVGPEAVSVTGPVIVPTNLEVLTLWDCGVDTGIDTLLLQTVRFLGPKGEALHVEKLEPRRLTKRRYRARLQFPGLLYVGAGVYRVVVEQERDGQTRVEADVPLQVIVEGVGSVGAVGPPGVAEH